MSQDASYLCIACVKRMPGGYINMKKISLLIALLWFVSALLCAQTVNADKAAKGKWQLGQKLLWQTDSAGAQSLSSVQNVLIGSDGRLAVLDNKEYRIHLYDQAGKYIGACGKRGEGPGEFKTLNQGQQIFAAGRQIVFAERGRLQRFDRQGKFIGQTNIPSDLDPVAFIDSDRLLSAPGSSDQPDKAIPLELFDCSSNQRKSLTSFKPFAKATASDRNAQRTVTVAVIVGNITPLMLAGSNREHIAFGMSDRYEISVIDLTGWPVCTFSVPDRKAVPVSRRFKEDLKKRIGGNAPVDMVERIIDGLPPTASFFSDIRILGNGMILVFVSDPDRQDGATIDIFSPLGRLLYQADFTAPAGHTIENYEFSENRLFLASQDEEGTPYLNYYQIDWPKE